MRGAPLLLPCPNLAGFKRQERLPTGAVCNASITVREGRPEQGKE